MIDIFSYKLGKKASGGGSSGGTGGGTGGGGTPVKMKDVNFYDYDGTLLHSYTVAEAQALTELPPLPTQSGLICQGWNYDLATIKSYNRAVNVGAIYITDDDKTRLYIRIATEGRMDVPLWFFQTVANGVTIDWGDGSTTETLSGTGSVKKTHTYANIGDYVISLEVADGCKLTLGNDDNSYCVLGYTGEHTVYSNMLQKVEIGKGITNLGNYAFARCHSLKTITIPNSVTSLGNYLFSNCSSFKTITIPNSVTSIPRSLCYYCYSLVNAIMPDSITSISDYAFQKCQPLTNIIIPNRVIAIGQYTFEGDYSITSIIIPEGVTDLSIYMFSTCKSLAHVIIPSSVSKIRNRAFAGCDGVGTYDFTKHTSVPTLSNSDAFSTTFWSSKILVPAALYDEWIAATNWSSLASKIVAV